MPDETKTGATGSFPKGKIHESDEGEIRFRMVADKVNGVVIVDFGSPVKWLGLPKAEAITIGEALIKHANELP
jgi:hypothetical protein